MERLTDKNYQAINKCGQYSSCYSCHRDLCYITEICNKLGQLENILEKYGIESVEELDERLGNAIIPRFKVGDKCFAIIDTWAYTDVFPFEIRDYHLLYEGCDGDDTTKQHCTRVFATKEEAQAKLKELKGE